MLPRTTTRGPLDKRGVDMDTSETTHTPEESGLLRRGLFPRREQAQADPMTETETRLDETVRRAVDDRVEAGMRQIEDQATGLLREVATEVWRTSAKDVRPEQERIMSLLARDQAIRSLITTSDERFQAIAMRTARLEDNLADLAESERRTREAMESASDSIREISQSPTLHGVEMVRTQLEQVEAHLAETLTHFDERDREIAEQLERQVREHGELITNETARIVESMQSYVQGGAEAIGRLAQRIEEHAKLFVLQDHNITQHVIDAVNVTGEDVMGQLELIKEKVGLHGRDQEQLQSAIERMIDARMRGMAELVRSDSMALQKLVEERMAAPSFVMGEDGQVAFDEASLARTIDQRMGALAQVVEERMDLLERTIAEQVLALSNATAASMDRNLERMSSAAGAVDGLDEMVAEGQQAFEERMLDPHRRAHGADRTARALGQPGPGRQGRGVQHGRHRADRDAGRRTAPFGAPLDQGAPGGDGLRHAGHDRRAVPAGGRPAAPRGPGAGRVHAQGRRGARPKDRPVVGPRRRRRRQRSADRRGSHVRRDPGDVGGSARHRVTDCVPAVTKGGLRAALLMSPGGRPLVPS